MISDHTLVCPHCGSPNLRMIDMHGWCECRNCGEEEHAVQYGDWLTSQEDHHMIPDGYNEP